MSQRRCFLCGEKVRPGEGDHLSKRKSIHSNTVTETHLFCGACCGNTWLIWHGHHARWNGIRWSLSREKKRHFIGFATTFIYPEGQLPKTYPNDYLWRVDF